MPLNKETETWKNSVLDLSNTTMGLNVEKESTVYRLEDLPSVITNRDEWWETIKGFHAVNDDDIDCLNCGK